MRSGKQWIWGRWIAVYCDTMSMDVSHLYARGGNAGNLGSAGTVYVKDSGATNGVLIIDNGNVASSLKSRVMSEMNSFAVLQLSNRGRLYVDSYLALGDLLVKTLGEVLLSYEIDVLGNVRLESGGKIRRP